MQLGADDAEALAATSIAFAFMAIDDAEIATLEAIEARVCKLVTQRQNDRVKTLYLVSHLTRGGKSPFVEVGVPLLMGAPTII